MGFSVISDFYLTWNLLRLMDRYVHVFDQNWNILTLFYLSIFVIETEFHVAQTGFELTVQSKLFLNITS